ncbi:MAG: oligosaccharide flippase family protein [Gemmataceae bacterium]
MADTQKILSAARSNWWLNALGLALSFCAGVVLVRTLTQDLYAQYQTVVAMIWFCTLIFDAGGNSGLTRYLAEAGRSEARGSFYRSLQRRRWLIALGLSVVVIAFGPWYAEWQAETTTPDLSLAGRSRATELASLADEPFLFVMIAAIVVSGLTRGLAHYGMVALFETRRALLWEQAFLVSRSALLAVIALCGGGLWALVVGLLAINVVEAISADVRLMRFIGQERAPLPVGMLNKAQGFGLLTIFDKACAGLGSGPALLLLLRPFHPLAELAVLALAVELTSKLISLTVMPMSNLVAPYLSQAPDDPAAQARAIGWVVKCSSLLYCFSIGAGLLLAREFVPLVYGAAYADAAVFTLALLAPIAFENWVRGVASPALLRNGRGRALAALNVLQASVTLGAIWLVHEAPLLTAVTVVVTARAVVASLSLLLLAPLVAPGAFRVPLQAALLAACAAGPWLLLEPLPLPALARLLVQGSAFALAYYLGLRWVVLRDGDMLRLAHRLAGRGAASRLLPPLPC